MLKFFRQQMILQFDWLKIFYTLCFRINITGRKTLKNNYLLWELQLLVPHCVRRNQGGSLFCQWLYSALHWHLMPLVPQVNRIAMVLLWEPFNTWAWQQWNESFVSCLENLECNKRGSIMCILHWRMLQEGVKEKKVTGFEAQIQNSFTIPTSHQTFFTQIVTLICQKNWEKWSTMVERITKMPQAKKFKDLLIAVQANMGWDGEGFCTHSWSRNSNTKPNSKWCYTCCCCSLKQTIKKEIRGFIYLKDGIPLQIQSCEKSKYRNPTVEFTRRKKTLLLLLCIYACPSSAFHKWKSLMDSGLPSKRSLQQRCGWQWWVHRSPPEALRSHKP